MLLDNIVYFEDGDVEAEVDKAFRGRFIGRRYECWWKKECGECGKTAAELSRATRLMPGMGRLDLQA